MINIQVYFSMLYKNPIESPKTKNKYIFTEQLGRGNYGKVYFSHPYAVKVVNLALKQTDFIQMLRNQAKLLSEIKNKNVVSLIEYFEIEKQLYLVMQYCQTDLQKYLKVNQGLSEQKIFCIFKQILSGYKEVYIKQIIHRDIKPPNILVKNNSQFKLADFGLARYVAQNQLLVTSAGSPLFSSPQILKSEKYSIKNDIWSLGVLLYFMIFNQYPWQANRVYDLINKISLGLSFPLNNKESHSTIRLLKKMLKTQENQRIQWIQLFQIFDIQVPSLSQQKQGQSNLLCKSAQKKYQKQKEGNSQKKRSENLKTSSSSSNILSSQNIKKNNHQISLHPNPHLKRLGEENNKKSQKNKSQAGQNESKITIVSLFIQGAKKFRNFIGSISNKDSWTSEEIKQLIQVEGSIYCGELVASKVFRKKYKKMSPCEREDFRKILNNFNVNFQKAAKLVYQLNDE